MEVIEALERLKEDIKRHFDNEMELLRRAAELRTIMTDEQSAELLRAALEHPHADTARAMFSDPEAVEELMKIIHGERGRAEPPEEET